MFSHSEHWMHAIRELIDAQLAALTAYTHAAFDAGLNAAELNVDTAKTALAAATVSTRQWLAGFPLDHWLGACAAPHQAGQLALALRSSVTPPAHTHAGPATELALE